MFDSAHHPDDETLRAHAARRLAPAAALELSDHLAECAACRERLRAAERPATRTPVELDPPRAHSGPDYAELAGAATGRLEAEVRADFDRRVAGSPQLAAELADLEALAAAAGPGQPELVAPDLPPNVVPFTRPSPAQPWRLRLLASAAMLVLGAGLWWLLAGQGRLPADLQALAERSGEAASLDQLISPDLRPRPLQLAGGPAEAAGPVALAPLGTALRESAPKLQWQPRHGAQGYRVALERVDNGEIVTSPVLPAEATHWTPTQPLTAGAIYQWEVEALGPDGALLGKSPKPPEPEARFRILTAAEQETLRRDEARAGGNAFVLGALRARAGLREEAKAAFAEAARAGSAAAEKLSK